MGSSEADKIIHERSNKASEKYQNHVKNFLERKLIDSVILQSDIYLISSLGRKNVKLFGIRKCNPYTEHDASHHWHPE